MPALDGVLVNDSGAHSANAPMWALVTSPSETLCITELGFDLFFTTSVTTAALGLTKQTAAFVGQQYPDAVRKLLIADGSANLPPLTTFDLAFQNAPVPAANTFFRRLTIAEGGATGPGPNLHARFIFPRGYILPPSMAVVCWLTTVVSSNPYGPRYNVNVRADG